ncbi:MAG: hypothetical protein BGO51_24105 [Rhodospirillales bacterium 69-11]|nr:hypothetical protein [Rhodospirillales bacterium]OJW22326.1 MAG: hypothetical protein BGO51_24105 [Rhodospirillales bacterium 69-11]
MRRRVLLVSSASALVIGTFLAPGQAGAQGAGQGAPQGGAQPVPTDWPRSFTAGGEKLEIYQPQIDTWDGIRLTGRAAFAIGAADGVPTYGVARIAAEVQTDNATQVALLKPIRITAVELPTDPGKTEAIRQAMQARLPAQGMTIGLQQLTASYARSQQAKPAPTVEVKNEPPRIVFASQPTVLLPIDGAPVVRPVAGTPYQRVINTPALLLQDAHATYTTVAGRWYMAPSQNGAPSLDGPWSILATPPAALTNAAAAAAKQQPYDKLAGKPNTPAPALVVGQGPTELVLTQGPPEWGAVKDTTLQAMRNADHAVLMEGAGGTVWLLISGRWFAGPGLEGPWHYVAPDALPAEFRKIPPGDPVANVLVSVPGTPQAREAVIAASVPQTATVKRSAAKLTVSYAGSPQFAPITGTSLTYAVNTATPVIGLPNGVFYALSGGVWFVAPKPAGPWAVADMVPSAIYMIPPSSPLYYVTYVRVYQATPELVVVGYTPGYMGVVVSPAGTVVYGTGYVYPAYVGTVWYGYPPTYGYGAGFALGAATGFAFGFAAGAIWGSACTPYWGPYYYHGGARWGAVNVNQVNVYNRWGGAASVTTASGWRGANTWQASSVSTFNPYNGRQTVSQQGRVYNNATGAEAAGHRGATYNPTTGNAAAGRSAAGYNPQTGQWGAGEQRAYNTDNRAGASSRTATGTAGSGTATTSGRGVTYNKNTGNAVGWNNGSVYAGHDGNVYKREDGSWEQHTSSGWQSVSPSANTQNLEQQRQARELGASRSWGGGERGGWRNR